jgi:hypothetical protein
MLNPDGNDGPSVKSVFSCADCKYLGESVIAYGKKPYKCFHEETLKYSRTINLNGDISIDKITPSFCPLLMKKLRAQKLKEINSND